MMHRWQKQFRCLVCSELVVDGPVDGPCPGAPLSDAMRPHVAEALSKERGPQGARACVFCKRTAEELGPIGMWQHCPEHEGGSLLHEMETAGPQVSHAKSAANPDWPHESYCVLCGQEWPCRAGGPEGEESGR